MAYYDRNKKQFIRFPAVRSKWWPAWLEVDCGCCAGVEWGGEEPRDCRLCDGKGYYYVHAKTGTCAQYPGGPFNYGCHWNEKDLVQAIFEADDIGVTTPDHARL